jgi:hypothetical protein
VADFEADFVRVLTALCRREDAFPRVFAGALAREVVLLRVLAPPFAAFFAPPFFAPPFFDATRLPAA